MEIDGLWSQIDLYTMKRGSIVCTFDKQSEMVVTQQEGEEEVEYSIDDWEKIWGTRSR